MQKLTEKKLNQSVLPEKEAELTHKLNKGVSLRLVEGDSEGQLTLDSDESVRKVQAKIGANIGWQDLGISLVLPLKGDLADMNEFRSIIDELIKGGIADATSQEEDNES